MSVLWEVNVVSDRCQNVYCHFWLVIVWQSMISTVTCKTWHEINCNHETDLNGKIPRIDTFSSLIKTLEGALHDMSGLYLHLPSVVDWIVDCVPIIYRCLSVVVSANEFRVSGKWRGITRVKSCSICGIRTRNLSYSQLFVKEMKTKYLRLSARPQRNSCSCSPASFTFEIYLLKGCCGTGTNALCRPSFFSLFWGNTNDSWI